MSQTSFYSRSRDYRRPVPDRTSQLRSILIAALLLVWTVAGIAVAVLAIIACLPV